MSKSINQLDKAAYNLLNYCAKNNDWSPNYSTPAIIDFVIESQNDEKIKSIWYVGSVHDILYDLLDHYKDSLLEKNHNVSNDNAIIFSNRFRNIMKINIIEHWLVLPIHQAKLKNIIEFGDYLFIPEHFSRNDKIKILAEKSQISFDEMAKRADHTENTRSKNFYQYTLMCRKISHHTSFVHVIGRRIILLDFAILRTLNYSHELQPRAFFGGMSIEEIMRQENRHVVICSKESSRWGHFPIWADAQSTTLPGDLNWLNDNVCQEKLIEFEKNIGYLNPIDRLAYRFRRAIMFFSKAVDLQRDAQKRFFEGFGLEILHLMIAAESLLLDRESEKRLRLATLLSRLVHIEGISSKEIFNNIDICYSWRSDYVHSGDDVFPEYDENLKEGQIQKRLYLLRHIMAKLIIDAPEYLLMTENLAKTTHQGYSVKIREKIWFNYLNDLWNSILSGSE